MRWLQLATGIGVLAALAALPVSASARHQAPAVGAPPGYYLTVQDGVDNPPGGQGTASVSCPNAVVWGGGIANEPGSSLGVSVSVSSPTGKLGWIGRVNNPTAVDAKFDVYGVCANHPKGYAIVEAAVNAAAGANRTTTARCPAGTQLLSGGADSATSSPLAQITSGAPEGATAFTAYMSNGSSAAAKLQVFAVCSDPRPGYVIKTKAVTDKPGESSHTITCPTNTSTLGGGISLAQHNPSVYMTASVPLGSGGWRAAVTNETTANVAGAIYTICGR